MKRMHIHISVDDLAKSIDFYATLFGTSPTETKSDYAKWMLDEPTVNFAISQRNAKAGLDHVGIQVDDEAQLAEIQERMAKADMDILTQEGTTCCYAKSDKHWVQDPSGIAWEAYHTLESAPTFNDAGSNDTEKACCAPTQTIQILNNIGTDNHDSKSGCC